VPLAWAGLYTSMPGYQSSGAASCWAAGWRKMSAQDRASLLFGVAACRWLRPNRERMNGLDLLKPINDLQDME
jgi:hypothetical protein